MTADLVIVETRRSKGIHKADCTAFTKEQIKEILKHYNSNSYVVLMNYRTNCLEIKFETLRNKGTVTYCLKTSLTKEDFKELGFQPTEKGNLHFTQKGCSIARFDVKVLEPVKKIKTEKKKDETKDKKAVDTKKGGKAPLPGAVKAAKAPLPGATKASTKPAVEEDDEDEDEE